MKSHLWDNYLVPRLIDLQSIPTSEKNELSRAAAHTLSSQ
jgi:hypothetical protein